MQRHLVASDAMGVDVFQHLVGKVQACRGSRHAALNLGINRLVSGLVALLGLAVEVWRNGKLAHGVKNLGEVDLGCVPLEIDPIVGAPTLLYGLAPVHRCRQGELVAFYLKVTLQRAILPFLQVAYHAEPTATCRRLGHLLVVDGLRGLHEEDLYQRASLLAEVHARLDDPRVVEHHKRALGKILRKIIEDIIRQLALVVYQQLAVVAFLQWELCYTLIWKTIVIIVYSYMFCIHVCVLIHIEMLPNANSATMAMVNTSVATTTSISALA